MKTTYYYTYRITNTQENKHYYGTRGCNIPPIQDLGIKYFSSSYDKQFKQLQKTNPTIFKYKVIRVYTTREQAIALEVRLHTHFDVARNPHFYNQAKQTSNKFDRSGCALTEQQKNVRSKPIINLDTKQKYQSIIEACRQTGIHDRVIINVCKRRKNQTTAGGFHWAYVVEGADSAYYTDLLEEIIQEEKTRSLTLGKQRTGKGNPCARPANIYCYLTNKLVAENVLIYEWARTQGVSAPHLSSTVSGKRKHSGGYYARRE